MAPLIRAAASVVIALIIGYGLVLLMFRARPLRNAALLFALSLGLGFGFLAVCGTVFLAFASRIYWEVIYLALAATAVGILYEKRKDWLSRFRERFSSARAPGKESGYRAKPAPEKIALSAARVFGAIIFLIVAFNLLARPMYQFDSRAIWGQKAKILFHERTIFSQAVTELSSNHPHPRYPLLLPMASAWVFHNMREPDDRAVRLLFFAFFIGLVVSAYQLQRTHAEGAGVEMSVAALLAAPFIYTGMRGGAASGHADIILSFYITTSALAMILWMKENNRAFMMASALLAACAALTKNEGLIFALNLFLTASIFSLAGDKALAAGERRTSFAGLGACSAKLYDLATYVVVILAVLAPWLFVRSRLPSFLDENYLAHLNYDDITAGLSRFPEIIKTFGGELLNFKHWGLLWMLMGLSLLGVGTTWKKESYFIASLMVLQVAAYLAIFVITPNDLRVQMRDSLSRLILHVLPLGMALVAFQIGGTWKTSPTRK